MVLVCSQAAYSSIGGLIVSMIAQNCKPRMGVPNKANLSKLTLTDMIPSVYDHRFILISDPTIMKFEKSRFLMPYFFFSSITDCSSSVASDLLATG